MESKLIAGSFTASGLYEGSEPYRRWSQAESTYNNGKTSSTSNSSEV